MHRFLRDERGAVLVEFVITLPLMILFFAIIVETARIFWSYQLAISGVRDATRYMSRVIPQNSCTVVGGYDMTAHNTTVTDIVTKDRRWPLGNMFPTSITVNSVTPTLDCSATGTYRNGIPPIVTVTANFTVRFPMSFAWDYFGDGLSTGVANVSDQARVFGQ